MRLGQNRTCRYRSKSGLYLVKPVGQKNLVTTGFTHFAIYFILGITVVSFFREFSIPIRKLLLLSIFLAFLYACSDEIHQLFVPGRSGQFIDVLLDTCGASVGVGLYVLLFRKKIKEVPCE